MAAINIKTCILYNADMLDSNTTHYVGFYEKEKRLAINAVADIFNTSWANWTPTIVYTGTNNITVATIAKYRKAGNTVDFILQQMGTGLEAGVPVTDVTFTLPETPADNNTYPAIRALQVDTGGTYKNPRAYIDMTTGSTTKRLLKFYAFNKVVTNTYAIHVAGQYEIA